MSRDLIGVAVVTPVCVWLWCFTNTPGSADHLSSVAVGIIAAFTVMSTLAAAWFGYRIVARIMRADRRTPWQQWR